MTFRLVSERWGAELDNALRRDRSELRIVSPFIKIPAMLDLIRFGGKADAADVAYRACYTALELDRTAATGRKNACAMAMTRRMDEQ